MKHRKRPNLVVRMQGKITSGEIKHKFNYIQLNILGTRHVYYPLYTRKLNVYNNLLPQSVNVYIKLLMLRFNYLNFQMFITSISVS